MGTVLLDRWVLPPAIATALFSLAAISPPVATTDLDTALRVEAIVPFRVARAGLMRISVLRTQDDTPIDVSRVRVTDPQQRSAACERSDALAVASCVLPAFDRVGTQHITVLAGAHRATIALPIEAPAPRRVREPQPAPALSIVVLGGALLPGTQGTVLVRAPGAVEVHLTSDLDAVRIEPARVTPDACGVARFRVVAEAMGAPVSVTALRADGSRAIVRERLAVWPGGITLAHVDDHLEVRGAFQGLVTWVVGGDDDGPRWWRARRLVAHDDGGIALLQWPAHTTWVRASLDGRFLEEHAPALGVCHESVPCVGADGMRWCDAVLESPRPRVETLLDGVANARHARNARIAKARSRAWACLALSIAIEIALVVGLGLRTPTLRSKDADTIEAVHTIRRGPIAPLLTGVVLLMIVGFALSLSSMISAELR